MFKLPRTWQSGWDDATCFCSHEPLLLLLMLFRIFLNLLCTNVFSTMYAWFHICGRIYTYRCKRTRSKWFLFSYSLDILSQSKVDICVDLQIWKEKKKGLPSLSSSCPAICRRSHHCILHFYPKTLQLCHGNPFVTKACSRSKLNKQPVSVKHTKPCSLDFLHTNPAWRSLIRHYSGVRQTTKPHPARRLNRLSDGWVRYGWWQFYGGLRQNMKVTVYLHHRSDVRFIFICVLCSNSVCDQKELHACNSNTSCSAVPVKHMWKYRSSLSAFISRVECPKLKHCFISTVY